MRARPKFSAAVLIVVVMLTGAFAFGPISASPALDRTPPKSCSSELGLPNLLTLSRDGAGLTKSGQILQDQEGEKPLKDGAETHKLTLITGDRITVMVAPDGRKSVSVEFANPSERDQSFRKFRWENSLYVIPGDVDLRKFDRELFNVSYLIEENYYQLSSLPVIITGSPSTNKDLGILGDRVKKVSRSTYSYPNLSMVAAGLSIENIKNSYEALSSLNGGKVWLDRKLRVQLDESVPLVGAPEMWEDNYSGENQIIAILDTGIDETHPDLDDLDDNGGTADPKVLVTKNFTDDNSTDDLYGHGTHCAGIAAGTGEASDYQYKGVAPGAYLWSVKVMNREGVGYDSWIIDGIEYAVLGPDSVENTGDEADVLSMSFGVNMNGDGTDPVSRAVDWATDQGMVCAVAAGNSGPEMSTVGRPAVARKAITVGATTKDDDMVGFSSRGPTADYRLKPDVVAPGVDIVAPRASETSMGSSVNDYYTSASGTSMSTPHVAGAVALLLQAHPDWSPVMVKSALMGNAKVLENIHLWSQGAGRIRMPEAENTILLAIEPSLSFGIFSEFGENKSETLTLMNRGDSPEEVSISTENVETEVSVVPSSLTIPARENAEVLVQVGPVDENTSEGWHEGRVNITDNQGRALKVPYLFGIMSELTVDVYDIDNTSKISAIIGLATYPDMTFTSLAFYEGGTSAEFLVESGDYAVLAQSAWVKKEDCTPEWDRMFMLENTVNVPKFSKVNVGMSLADASVSKIPTVDNSGENLITHCYTQKFCGDPYYDTYVGTTMMEWGLGGGWSGFDIKKSELTFYSSRFDPPENLSQALGFYASDNLLSEVYLLNWKYRSVPSLPLTITHDYSDLAKYDFKYDMPETYPEKGLNSMNAFWFTWDNISGSQVWSWDVHQVPVGMNAKYYLAPSTATYWGVYMPTYEGWDDYTFGPLQEWEIGRHYPYPQIPPEKGETGSKTLGNFQFAPYAPGLSLDIAPENGSHIVTFTGDIWENLTWPHWQWYRIFPTPTGPISPYPQDTKPQYSLYVDNQLISSGVFSRINIDKSLGIWWDNIKNLWDVAGENGRFELRLPSMGTISERTTYELRFDLSATDNIHIPSIFDSITMSPSYSPDENIAIQIETSSDLENIVLEYSFDNGASWKTTQDNSIPCEVADELTIRVSAKDQWGNSLVYTSNPISMAEKVNLSVPERVLACPGETVEISGNITTLEGKGLKNFAVALSDNNKITTYASTNENGFFALTYTAPTAIGEHDFAVVSPSAGVYQSSEAPVRLIVKYLPQLTSPEDGSCENDNAPLFEWAPDVTTDDQITIKIDDDADMSSPLYEKDLGTGHPENHVLPAENALSEGVYYWQVEEATDGSSAVWSFRIDQTLPPAPDLDSPADGTVDNSQDQAFSWSLVSENSTPVRYYLEVDNDSDFSSPEVTWNGTATSASVTILSDDNFSWRACAKDNAGNWGPHSSVWTLIADITPPSAPILSFPPVGFADNEQTQTLDWNPASDALAGVDNYEIYVDNSLDQTVTDNTVTHASVTFSERVYTWYVKAVDYAGNENASSSRSITIDLTAPPAPTLVSPADGENTGDNTPNLDWQTVLENSTPVLYRCHVSDNSAFLYDNYDSRWTLDDNFQVPAEMAEGAWYWRVQARDNAGNVGDTSAVHFFGVDVTQPGRPALLSPENNDNTAAGTPTFEWSAVSDPSGVTYVLVIDNESSFDPTYYVYHKTGIIDNQHTCENALTLDNYYWRVRVVDEATNEGEWSDWCRFEVLTTEIELNLYEGWDLFSLPLSPENAEAENVFSELPQLPTIYGLGEQGYASIGKGDNLEVGRGYWVYVEEAENVTICGTPVESIVLELNAGWNLVGMPSGVLPTTPGDIWSEVPTIYGWGAEGYNSLKATGNFETGQGYWIYSETSENIPVGF